LPEYGAFSDTDLDDFRRHYRGICVETVPYPGIVQMLGILKGNGLGMGIATSKFTEYSVQILEHLDMMPYFETVVGGDQVDNWKPDPEAVLKVLASTGWEAGSTLMVGDSPVDLRAGRSAGTKTCGVTWGYGRRTDLENERPDLIAEHPLEIVHWHGLERIDG
jgi:phosphoglycolate phosphatase